MLPLTREERFPMNWSIKPCACDPLILLHSPSETYVLKSRLCDTGIKPIDEAPNSPQRSVCVGVGGGGHVLSLTILSSFLRVNKTQT